MKGPSALDDSKRISLSHSHTHKIHAPYDPNETQERCKTKKCEECVVSSQSAESEHGLFFFLWFLELALDSQ